MSQGPIVSGFKILLANVCFVVYCVTVVYPFFSKNVQLGEITQTWRYEAAPLHYVLLFYSAFWVYLCFIARHILKVQYIRTIVYSISFVVTFLACHGLMLIRGHFALFETVIGIPLGGIFLCLLLFWAFKKDIQDKLSPFQKKEDVFVQKLLSYFTLIAVPVLLISFAFNVLNDGTSSEKEEKTPITSQVKEEKISIPDVPLTAGCEYLSGLLKKASENIDFSSSAALDKVAEAYQSEFQKKELYGKIELNKLTTDYAEYHLYRNKIVWLIFRFEKKGKCTPNSRNCFFSVMHAKNPCVQYVTAKPEKK